jgi:hypothetical protein
MKIDLAGIEGTTQGKVGFPDVDRPEETDAET